MDSDSKKRAEIRQKRMNKAFVDTAKNMIIDKGFENVTVRAVADETGYTVVTLYKHFENFDDLLWQTREDIVSDLVNYLLDKTADSGETALIRRTFKEYINYCTSKPNAFKFLFFYQQKNTKDSFDDNNYMSSMTEVFTKAFYSIAQNSNIDHETVMKKSNTVFFAVHGMLTVYLSNNYGLTREMLYQSLDDAMNFILGEK